MSGCVEPDKMDGLFDIAPAALTSPRPEPGKAVVPAKRGPIRRGWTLIDGAAKYEKEVRLGYIRLPVLQEQAAKQCRACPMAQRFGGAIAGPRTFWFCGPMGDENLDDADPAQRHCGCVVLEGTEGSEEDPVETSIAAGRTLCSRYECPQGNWGKDEDLHGPRRVRGVR